MLTHSSLTKALTFASSAQRSAKLWDDNTGISLVNDLFKVSIYVPKERADNAVDIPKRSFGSFQTLAAARHVYKIARRYGVDEGMLAASALRQIENKMVEFTDRQVADAARAATGVDTVRNTIKRIKEELGELPYMQKVKLRSGTETEISRVAVGRAAARYIAEGLFTVEVDEYGIVTVTVPGVPLRGMHAKPHEHTAAEMEARAVWERLLWPNGPVPRSARTRFGGVGLNQDGKWDAVVLRHNYARHLGSYDTMAEAELVWAKYDAALRELAIDRNNTEGVRKIRPAVAERMNRNRALLGLN